VTDEGQWRDSLAEGEESQRSYRRARATPLEIRNTRPE